MISNASLQCYVTPVIISDGCHSGRSKIQLIPTNLTNTLGCLRCVTGRPLPAQVSDDFEMMFPIDLQEISPPWCVIFIKCRYQFKCSVKQAQMLAIFSERVISLVRCVQSDMSLQF